MDAFYQGGLDDPQCLGVANRNLYLYETMLVMAGAAGLARLLGQYDPHNHTYGPRCIHPDPADGA